MRRWLPLLISLVLNAALGIWLWLAMTPSSPPPSSTADEPAVAAPTTNVVRTNVVVRRQNFVWNQIESEDYPIYIDNLRKIGCPEDTIRDIIVAEVNQLFARRRATEVITPRHQWWRADPDPIVAAEAVETVRRLENERRALLTQLLGPDWESVDYPNPDLSGVVPLDGPILGGLDPEVRQAVLQIERAGLQSQEEYLSTLVDSGQDADPLVIQQFRLQTREELAKVLPAEAFEEYLLRYSSEAMALRQQLQSLETTPDEFRVLFATLDPLDQEILALGQSARAHDLQRLAMLRQERAEALGQVLGEERSTKYDLLQDPLYRQAQTVQLQAAAPEELVLPLAEIYRLTQEEEARILADNALSLELRQVQLEEMRLAREEAIRDLLGDVSYQRYSQTLPASP